MKLSAVLGSEFSRVTNAAVCYVLTVCLCPSFGASVQIFTFVFTELFL